MVANGSWYLFGAALCIVWRWMDWLKKQPTGTAMNKFWRDRLPTNVSSLLVSFLMMGAYLSGALSGIIRAMAPDDWAKAVPVMYTEWWAAGPAGFMITYGARRIVGHYAEKIGAKEDE